VYLLGKHEVLGEDANGETGTYTATFHLCPNPSTSLEIELDLPLRGTPLITITSNYSGWPKHSRLRVQSLGVREDRTTPTPGITPYVLPDGILHFRPLKQRVRHVGAQAYGEIVWRGDIGQCSVHRFDPAGRFEDLRPGWAALREFEGIRPRPGPRPGTVKAAKYTTPTAWQTAIREKVLTKTTRLSADDETIAFWLEVSSTTMYRLMARWGPKSLDDLRNGRL
jgi:hypothetical protein